MRAFRLFPLLFALSVSSIFASSAKHAVERAFNFKNFKGKICLTELPDNRIEIRIRTWRTTRDTILGQNIYPVLVNGVKQSFFFGHFGASQLPMLIFATSDPSVPQESRAAAFQVSPRGALIGQQVVVDENAEHGHSDDVRSGRYALTDIDPKLGAIYSIASQSAHF